MEKRRHRLAKRVTAEPSMSFCPLCKNQIYDWHREWYKADDRVNIYKKKNAADCPVCRAGVILGFTVEPIPPNQNLTILTRQIHLAEQWAEAMGTNLRSYLEDTQAGKQYAGYFSQEI